jgi:hypothetical protein
MRKTAYNNIETLCIACQVCIKDALKPGKNRNRAGKKAVKRVRFFLRTCSG